jgi:hypothetical protein
LAQAAQARDVDVKQELAEVAVEVKRESMEVKQERLDLKQEPILERLEVKREMLEVKQERLEVKQEPADFVGPSSGSGRLRLLGSMRIDAELGVLRTPNNNHVDVKTERTIKTEVSEEFRGVDQVIMVEPSVTR